MLRLYIRASLLFAFLNDRLCCPTHFCIKVALNETESPQAIIPYLYRPALHWAYVKVSPTISGKRIRLSTIVCYETLKEEYRFIS